MYFNSCLTDRLHYNLSDKAVRDMIADYRENWMEHTNVICEQNAEFS